MHTEGIIYSSMAVLLITGMFMNLMDIAQTTADTTLTFATDMNLALDCATRGVSIFECSPNLDPEPFVKQLKKRNPDVKIDRYDERFTSKLAHQTMLSAGLGKQKRQNKASHTKNSFRSTTCQ